MKQCPVCKNTYTDETLTFCLSDGTRLSDFYQAAATVILPNPVKPTEANYGRVNIPVNSVSTETIITPPVISDNQTSQTEKKRFSSFAIVAVFGLLGIFLLAGIIVGYFFLKDNQTLVANNSSTPNSNISQNNSNEQDLKNKVDQLQKQLDEQKNAANKATPSTTSTPPISTKTAQVNSPSDGFLAMRSGPSHKSGSQIMKMPHGATINVYNCQNSTTIAGKTGRWCQVSYGGSNGWAFDAWLVY